MDWNREESNITAFRWKFCIIFKTLTSAIQYIFQLMNTASTNRV